EAAGGRSSSSRCRTLRREPPFLQTRWKTRRRPGQGSFRCLRVRSLPGPDKSCAAPRRAAARSRTPAVDCRPTTVDGTDLRLVQEAAGLRLPHQEELRLPLIARLEPVRTPRSEGTG